MSQFRVTVVTKNTALQESLSLLLLARAYLYNYDSAIQLQNFPMPVLHNPLWLFHYRFTLCGGSASLHRRMMIEWNSTSGNFLEKSLAKENAKTSPLQHMCSATNTTPYM